MSAKMFLVSQPSHLLLHHTPLRFFFGAWRRAGLIEPIVVYVVVVVVVVMVVVVVLAVVVVVVVVVAVVVVVVVVVVLPVVVRVGDRFAAA